jgi:hypothetical protein
MIVLDFLTSRIAMMVAAVIILTSVLAVFTMIREDGRELELRNTADTISGSINEINSINGETREFITFRKGKEGVYLEPEINGKSYGITLTRNKVMIRQDDIVFIEDLMGSIHLWEPEKTSYDLAEIEEKDRGNPQMNLNAHDDYIIEKKMINLQGENGYMTFVYMLKG